MKTRELVDLKLEYVPNLLGAPLQVIYRHFGIKMCQNHPARSCKPSDRHHFQELSKLEEPSGKNLERNFPRLSEYFSHWQGKLTKTETANLIPLVSATDISTLRYTGKLLNIPLFVISQLQVYVSHRHEQLMSSN